MSTLSTETLFIILAGLIVLSAFFSSSETGMMAINRYRLRHLARANHRGAKQVSHLLERPDRLISLILIGNNFVNIFASAIATIIAVRLFGDIGIAIASIILTIVVLLFAEVTPKTLAALYPEKIAFPASFILQPLLWILFPFVWLINEIANVFLRVLKVNPKTKRKDDLNRDELYTLLRETGNRIPKEFQQMLLGILELEKATIEEIMIPKNEIVGIDMDNDLETILSQLTHSQHTRLPLYKENINKTIGILHVRSLLNEISNQNITKETIMEQAQEPYFIPENTALVIQMQKFQHNKQRMGLVVDEYGDIIGLATLDDILEEIVGEFTTDSAQINKLIKPQEDGSVIVPGNITIRELNRAMNWALPTNGPKTLNGLILEALETIPNTHVSVLINNHPIEILQVKGNSIKSAKIMPQSVYLR